MATLYIATLCSARKYCRQCAYAAGRTASGGVTIIMSLNLLGTGQSQAIRPLHELALKLVSVDGNLGLPEFDKASSA
jgi:hypothetical protein